jgi:hypothetical protein
MKKFITIVIYILLSAFPCVAQVLKGKITGHSGEPIPFATVYIRELKQGTTSNTKGDYEIKLSPGKYTVLYQSLGFEQVTMTIPMEDNTIVKDVALPLQYYQIPEVRISATGEDPAYGIMRKAIGLAPYYLNNISHYKANVYLKGNLKIDRIPKLIKRSMEKEARKDSESSKGEIIKEGEVYLMESYNEIEFTAPDKYVQKVISYNSTFPEQGNEISPMQYISASFYQPVIADMAISPLSPNAFSHYKFRYLGATSQGNFTINKIQVIPKRKSQQLFEGTIYIIEGLWCLHSIDLTNDNIAGKVRIEQLYIPVQDDIWMPVSDKFDMKIDIMGFRGDAGYAVSVKYNDVIPNLALKKPSSITYQGQELTAREIPATDSTKNKKRKQIEKIMSKEELTNRDMVRLSKLMKQESENSVPDSIKNNNEIKEKTTHIIEKDAGKKDSTYWAGIRPIPLSDQEIRSIRVSDSARKITTLRQEKPDSTAKSGQKQNKDSGGFLNGIKHIGLGNTWSDKNGLSFRFGGLIEPRSLSFNTVDGFVYGFNFRLSKTWKDKGSLGIYPDVRWAFSRQNLLWRVNTSYKFGGMKPKEVFLRTGMTSKDIGTGGGINPLLNSITSLFFELNYLKLYESDYLLLGYRSSIADGLTAELTGNYEYRQVLSNTTDFRFINTSRDYSVNTPVNRYLGEGSNPLNTLRNQHHASIFGKLTFTPHQKYSVNGGNRVPAGSDWPTFSLSWEHGINDFRNSEITRSHYDILRAEVHQKRDIGAFSEFRWRIRTGGFLDNRNITYFDFFHFSAQPLPVLLNDYEDAFMNPAYYSLSTPEFFCEAHARYTTPYLLLKLLPGLSKTLMRENLSLSFLGTRYNPAYTEIGYTMSEIFLFAEAGVYAGFDGFRYRSAGIKIILKFIN